MLYITKYLVHNGVALRGHDHGVTGTSAASHAKEQRMGPREDLPGALMLEDAVSYWEPRRIAYNLALIAVAAYAVLRTWPHFRPAFAPGSIPPLAVLAALANLCYCAAYVVELLVHDAALREAWRRRRWSLWLAGTLVAMFIEYYWIVDEIYPDFPSVH